MRAVFLAVAVLFGALLSARRASAYPWMIRHEYTACGQCHLDPSGSGLLTEYGRALGETVLRTHYRSGEAAEDPGRIANFLWGAVEPPDWLLLGGSVRPALMLMKVGDTAMPGAPPPVWTKDVLLMEGDLRAGIKTGGFRASVSAGVISTGGSRASIKGNLVSREHWAGYNFDDYFLLVRAGRINVPFGLRSIDHTQWVRTQTRTDINDAQQHGVSVTYSHGGVRGELMGILGNYQISPDAYRERGYAGFLELAPIPKLAIGISSLMTYAQKDLNLLVPDLRQAHGVFFRATPFKELVLLGEGDLVLDRPTGAPNANGFASMVQADVEPIQGLHFIATAESWSPGGASTSASFGAWASVHWFFYSHMDVRFDYVYRDQAVGNVTLPVQVALLQLHAYL
ncbi:MAG: hypothetical protein ACHREM_21760 [Polyangiales bacterium]